MKLCRLAPPLVLLLAITVWAPARAEAPALKLAIADGKPLVWRGISAEEAAGSQGLNMLYPAPNAGGLLVAILTHALLVQGSRDAERSAAQTRADQVLEPHSASLALLTPERVLPAVQTRLPPALAQRSAGLVVQMEPRFAMASDQRTLVLDNLVRVHAVDAPQSPRFANLVRVVSAPRTEDDPAAHWLAEGGQALQQEATALLAHSVEVALTPTAEPDPAAFRTHRYRFGTLQKMERGQRLLQSCNRLVMRTLRDWLMSVPLVPAAGADCSAGDSLQARQEP